MANYYQSPFEREQMTRRMDNAVKGATTRSRAEELVQAERLNQIAMRGGLDGFTANTQTRSLNMALNDPKLTRSRRSLLLQNAAAGFASSIQPTFDREGRQINAGEISALASMGKLGESASPSPPQPPDPPPALDPSPQPPTPGARNAAPNLFQDAVSEPSESSTIISELFNPAPATRLGGTKPQEKQRPSIFDSVA